MGNRRAREFQKQQDRLAREFEEERARSRPRPTGFDPRTGGVGALRLQLVICPSFDEPRAWEIRQDPEEWALCSLCVTAPGPMLVGYDRVPFESERLHEFFRRVTALALPLGPDLSGSGGADGTVYQLGVFGDLHSEVRVQWWSKPPAHWEQLATIVTEMIRAFLIAQGCDPEAAAGWPE